MARVKAFPQGADGGGRLLHAALGHNRFKQAAVYFTRPGVFLKEQVQRFFDQVRPLMLGLDQSHVRVGVHIRPVVNGEIIPERFFGFVIKVPFRQDVPQHQLRFRKVRVQFQCLVQILFRLFHLLAAEGEQTVPVGVHCRQF